MRVRWDLMELGIHYRNWRQIGIIIEPCKLASTFCQFSTHRIINNFISFFTVQFISEIWLANIVRSFQARGNPHRKRRVSPHQMKKRPQREDWDNNYLLAHWLIWPGRTGLCGTVPRSYHRWLADWSSTLTIWRSENSFRFNSFI